MSEKFTFFWRGPLSQWSTSPFVSQEIQYTCAEQYMMASKAVLFQDTDTLEQIMGTKDPKIHQELGRKVKNFSLEIWNASARDVVYAGNLAKFSRSSTRGSPRL